MAGTAAAEWRGLDGLPSIDQRATPGGSVSWVGGRGAADATGATGATGAGHPTSLCGEGGPQKEHRRSAERAQKEPLERQQNWTKLCEGVRSSSSSMEMKGYRSGIANARRLDGRGSDRDISPITKRPLVIAGWYDEYERRREKEKKKSHLKCRTHGRETTASAERIACVRTWVGTGGISIEPTIYAVC